MSDGVDNPMLHRMRRPPLLQEIVLKVRSLGASRLGHNVSKQFVRHLALFPIKRTSFRRATKAAGEFLVVDECLDSVLLGLVVEVDVEGGECDGLAGHPADALEGEDLVCIVAERLVLPEEVS